MNTSEESTPLQAPLQSPLSADSYATFADAPPATLGPDPNNPPWGFGGAVLTWFASVMLMFVMQLLVITPYVIYRYSGTGFSDLGQIVLEDKTAVFLSIISIIPAHLLTLGIVWALVTGFGKRPFWPTLGWSWGENFGFWASAGLAVALLMLGGALAKLLGGEETQIDALIASSAPARYAVAILATATAPLVEEMVYRGVLYSALQRLIGALWAVVIVSALFALVHVAQYSNNLGVISAVSILSIALTLVRAYTGRLLPCFIMHLVFNGLQSVLIILQPYIESFEAGGAEQKAAFITLLTHI